MYKFNHKLLDLFDKKQDSNSFLFRKQNPFMTISVTYIFLQVISKKYVTSLFA